LEEERGEQFDDGPLRTEKEKGRQDLQLDAAYRETVSKEKGRKPLNLIPTGSFKKTQGTACRSHYKKGGVFRPTAGGKKKGETESSVSDPLGKERKKKKGGTPSDASHGESTIDRCHSLSL